MQSVKNSSSKVQNKLVNNLKMRQQNSEKPYDDPNSYMVSGIQQHTKSTKRIPQGGGSKYQGSASKVRGDSRSQNRKPTMDMSQGHKEGSLNRKQKTNAGPAKTKEEIQTETVELNQNAREVLEAYQNISQMWAGRNVPFQHRVAFIESVKVLDMKMMAQIFNKEVQDFELDQAPVINCMSTVNRREECLKEIHQISNDLND